MARDNVEILRSIYEAVNRRDWDAAFSYQHEDVELTIPPGLNPRTYRGRDECQAYIEDITIIDHGWTVEPEEFIERGDRIVVVARLRARPRGSSAEIAILNGHLWDLRDGKATSLEIFPEPERALEAAGR